jgi:sigma54-dependent transcription regulator
LVPTTFSRFLLAEARYLPARLIQSSPPRKKEQPRGAGEVTIIDLDLSRYNAIASRFAEERQQTLDFLSRQREERPSTRSLPRIVTWLLRHPDIK